MAGFATIDAMDLCGGSATHHSSCSIYPEQKPLPIHYDSGNRIPFARAVPSDLSQYETEWSQSLVSAQASHYSASPEPHQDCVLSALAAEAQQLWESASLSAGFQSRTCHPADSVPVEASTSCVPAFAGNFGTLTGDQFLGQLSMSTIATPPILGHGEQFRQPRLPTGSGHSVVAAVAVHRRRSIDAAIEIAAAAAAASAFCGLNSTSDAELEEFSLGPGCPRCPPPS
jgi:hypothetical protein